MSRSRSTVVRRRNSKFRKTAGIEALELRLPVGEMLVGLGATAIAAQGGGE